MQSILVHKCTEEDEEPCPNHKFSFSVDGGVDGVDGVGGADGIGRLNCVPPTPPPSPAGPGRDGTVMHHGVTAKCRQMLYFRLFAFGSLLLPLLALRLSASMASSPNIHASLNMALAGIGIHCQTVLAVARFLCGVVDPRKHIAAHRPTVVMAIVSFVDVTALLLFLGIIPILFYMICQVTMNRRCSCILLRFSNFNTDFVMLANF